MGLPGQAGRLDLLLPSGFSGLLPLALCSEQKSPDSARKDIASFGKNCALLDFRIALRFYQFAPPYY